MTDERAEVPQVTLSDVLSRLDLLQNSIDGVQARVEVIESAHVGDNIVSENTGANGGGGNSSSGSRGDGDASGSDTVQPARTRGSDQSIQEAFAIIKDSVSRSRLPVDLKLHDSGSVKKKCQPVYSVVRKCARYTETITKLLSFVTISESDEVSANAVSDIYACLRAEIRYLQEEYTGIIVQGRFGDDAGDIFTDLQKNTSVFTEDRLPLVRTAVELAGLRQQQQQTQGFRFSSNQRGSGGRGRSAYGSQRFSDGRYDRDARGNRNRSQDVFSNLASRAIPRDGQNANS